MIDHSGLKPPRELAPYEIRARKASVVDDLVEQIRRQIQSLRLACGASQRALDRDIGLAHGTWNGLERGVSPGKSLTADVLLRIEQHFALRPGELFERARVAHAKRAWPSGELLLPETAKGTRVE